MREHPTVRKTPVAETPAALAPPTCRFDADRDLAFAHDAPGFGDVLHVFDANWHGIRSASGCLPCHKLAISNEEPFDAAANRHIIGLIHKHRLRRIVFQGYSGVAHTLAATIKREFKGAVRLYAVTHVTSAQFGHHFEIDMQRDIHQALQKGILSRAGSVKPHFDAVMPGTWPHLLVNMAPNIPHIDRPIGFDPGAVFIPIENTWRKNLYTNVLAALPVAEVELIYSVNWPTALERIADLGKLKITPFRKGRDLLAFIGSMGALLGVTLAECQPMTQLEALAMGTPCLTGALGIDEFADDPLIPLIEVAGADNPAPIRAALERVLALRRDDPAALTQMIEAHLARRHALAVERLGDFLEL